MSRFTLSSIISGITLLSAGALWFTAVRGGPIPAEHLPPSADTAALAPAISPSPPPEVSAHAAPSPQTPAAHLATGIPATKRYTDPEFDFSFDYPAGHTVTAFWDETGYAILVSKPNSKEEFQIYIKTYDDSGPVTPEQILGDDPSFLVSNPKTINFPGIPVSALAFSSRNEQIGPSYELFFPYGGYLYHLTTYDGSRSILISTLNSWRFASSSTP